MLRLLEKDCNEQSLQFFSKLDKGIDCLNAVEMEKAPWCDGTKNFNTLKCDMAAVSELLGLQVPQDKTIEDC